MHQAREVPVERRAKPDGFVWETVQLAQRQAFAVERTLDEASARRAEIERQDSFFQNRSPPSPGGVAGTTALLYHNGRALQNIFPRNFKNVLLSVQNRRIIGAEIRFGRWRGLRTKAVRLYGVGDLRLEEFELPELRDYEILCEDRNRFDLHVVL